jgi:hypothetical protein
MSTLWMTIRAWGCDRLAPIVMLNLFQHPTGQVGGHSFSDLTCGVLNLFRQDGWEVFVTKICHKNTFKSRKSGTRVQLQNGQK